jgi:DNA gyrase subunit A
MTSDENTQIKELDISEEMKESYLDYAMSVIASRALPDIRDGFKPVHRRVLYAMYEQNYTHQKAYRKSARIVGDVLGKYHPHSDVAVYDSIVRMAQDFSMRETLIDGHGNFGSIDGDSAAAMRYTEIRLAPIAQYLTDSLAEDTVDFVPNYDGSEKEPMVLPTILPQLLLNGQQGIAVGMATQIPPHNLTELLDALIFLIDSPKASLMEVLSFIKGPDFPTAGKIIGMEGVLKAYQTGKGKVVLQGEAEIVEDRQGKEQIVITELPFLVNKAQLVLKIAECVRQQQIVGISDLRDESNKEGIRIVVDIKRSFSAQTVLLQIFEKTRLQDSFHVNMVCLVGGIPRQVGLMDVLLAFLSHRFEVIVRRSRFRLRKALAREHLLKGLLIVVESTDRVIELLRNAKHSSEAKQRLMETFGLDEIQSQAVLDLKLARLTHAEREKILKEMEEIQKLIAELRLLLSESDLVKQAAKKELEGLREAHPRERKTKILVDELFTPSEGELVNPAYVLVTLTKNGYIKRVLEDEIQAQRRATRGRRSSGLKLEDVMMTSLRAHTHNNLLFFTDQGRVFSLKVYDIPEAAFKHRGVLVADLVRLKYQEQVCQLFSFTDDEIDSQTYLFFLTERGMVKKTSLEKYKNARKTGIIGIQIKEGDRLLNVCLIKGDEHALLVSQKGKAMHFLVSQVNETGRSSRGVKGMKLDSKDRLVDGAVFDTEEAQILLVSERGYGKRARLADYRRTSRNTQGVMGMKVSDQTGGIAVVCNVQNESEDIILMTDKGRFLRMAKDQIRVYGRQARGLRLIRLDDDEKIITAGLSLEEETKESQS